MQPTRWFQVARSADVAAGDIYLFSIYWIDEAHGELQRRLTAAQVGLPDDVVILDSQV